MIITEKSKLRGNIITHLEKNAMLDAAEIATFLGVAEETVRDEIRLMEEEKIICGYGAHVNRNRLEEDLITALIEVKVTPVRGQGFNRIAERVAQFDEVKSVYLMSGGYDLGLIIEGRTLGEVAGFVSDKLSTMESVLSTATHFVLKTYKDHGVVFYDGNDEDERMVVSP